MARHQSAKARRASMANLRKARAALRRMGKGNARRRRLDRHGRFV